MSFIHIAFALILLLAIAAGLFRILAGPTAADRMMAAQLFGTCGVAIMLLLAEGMESPVLLDIALVFAILAAMATITFVRRAWHSSENVGEMNENT
ncbi:MAG: multiple resistance and pH regulation protein F [Proteobacteria bacterium]|nr:multiple resistance and pH regulation protein F [Pseudomonadota bacterium]MBU1716711.1 multiple resistance and pH regulation protein F [Pseudomonadota bacterium]